MHTRAPNQSQTTSVIWRFENWERYNYQCLDSTWCNEDHLSTKNHLIVFITQSMGFIRHMAHEASRLKFCTFVVFLYLCEQNLDSGPKRTTCQDFDKVRESRYVIRRMYILLPTSSSLYTIILIKISPFVSITSSISNRQSFILNIFC